MSINWWMDKQYVVHPYKGILFNNKKDTYNVIQPCKHYGQWKPVTKDYVLCNSLSMKHPGQANPQRVSRKLGGGGR